MIIFSFIFFAIIFSTVAKAQITIEPMQNCIEDIKIYHYEKAQTETDALTIYREQKWYNWLPKPGVGLNIVTSKPIFTLEAPDYIGYINRTKELKYRKFRVKQTTGENLRADTIAFISGYRELETLIYFHNKEAQLIANDSLMLQLKTEENKKLQATTEDVLKIKISLLEKKYNHEKSIINILSKAASLETYLHRNFKIFYSQ